MHALTTAPRPPHTACTRSPRRPVLPTGGVVAVPRGRGLHASAHHGAPPSPQVALSQYLEGEACAAKLLPMAGLLNAQFAARGLSLRVACLNNAAIVRLQEKDWGAAAALCTRALDLGPPDAISRAKALFRRALALAKLGNAPQALRDVREAHRLAPRDGEVLACKRSPRRALLLPTGARGTPAGAS